MMVIKTDTYRLSELFANPDLIDNLLETDTVTVDMLESEVNLSRQSESFITHAKESDMIINRLAEKAASMGCCVRQMHLYIEPGTPKLYYDSLAFIKVRS